MVLRNSVVIISRVSRSRALQSRLAASIAIVRDTTSENLASHVAPSPGRCVMSIADSPTVHCSARDSNAAGYCLRSAIKPALLLAYHLELRSNSTGWAK